MSFTEDSIESLRAVMQEGRKHNADDWNKDPRGIGVTVIGGLTGNGDMAQAELDQKIEATKESLRAVNRH